MVVKQDNVVMYRTLAKRWEERARRSDTDSARDGCEKLAQAYLSLVNSLDAGPKPQQERAG